ncbi:MAG: glycine cleavage system aminomethyltransferase GcvT [Halobacteriales archaeon]
MAEHRRPPLYAVHEERGAQFTGFGGWDMPVEFDGIQTEHEAVRESAGIFDVSHMGEVTVNGPDAAELTNRLVTDDVVDLEHGEVTYAAITDDDGVILDDTMVYRLPADTDDEYLFVPNAGHDEEMSDRWVAHREEWGLDATVDTVTGEWAMFALQGPEARDLAADVIEGDVIDLPRFEIDAFEVAGVETLISRTGYTGEDGLELLVPWDDAEPVWDALDAQPCGLGARDTLRMEYGFLLSGQDFDPEENPRTPFEGNIGFAVDLDGEFVGRDALARQREDGPEQRLAGIRMVDRGIPRHGYAIESPDGEEIGEVTSGTMSPTLGEPIGLGYVPVAYADEEGADVRVVVRGEPKKARIEALPFVA